MDISIVTCIYNNLPLVKKVIGAVQANPVGVEYEHVLVYNYPPDQTVLPWLKEVTAQDKRIHIVDPGKNIGCTEGYAYGFQNSSGEYIIKLDDDTLCPNKPEWGKIMVDYFRAMPSLGILTPDNNVKQGGKYVPYQGTVNGIPAIFYRKMDGIISFTCSMTPRKVYTSAGGFAGGVYSLGQRVDDAKYYGGEEADYVRKISMKGYVCGYTDSIFATHLDNTDRDPDYVLWKYCHGYKGVYKKDYVSFMKDIGARKQGWTYLASEPWANEWHKQEAAKFFKNAEQDSTK